MAILIDTSPADHAANDVVIPQREMQRFENYDSRPFTSGITVSLVIEGLRFVIGAQKVQGSHAELHFGHEDEISATDESLNEG